MPPLYEKTLSARRSLSPTPIISPSGAFIFSRHLIHFPHHGYQQKRQGRFLHAAGAPRGLSGKKRIQTRGDQCLTPSDQAGRQGPGCRGRSGQLDALCPQTAHKGLREDCLMRPQPAQAGSGPPHCRRDNRRCLQPGDQGPPRRGRTI